MLNALRGTVVLPSSTLSRTVYTPTGRPRGRPSHPVYLLSKPKRRKNASAAEEPIDPLEHIVVGQYPSKGTGARALTEHRKRDKTRSWYLSMTLPQALAVAAEGGGSGVGGVGGNAVANGAGQGVGARRRAEAKEDEDDTDTTDDDSSSSSSSSDDDDTSTDDEDRDDEGTHKKQDLKTEGQLPSSSY